MFIQHKIKHLSHQPFQINSLPLNHDGLNTNPSYTPCSRPHLSKLKCATHAHMPQTVFTNIHNTARFECAVGSYYAVGIQHGGVTVRFPHHTGSDRAIKFVNNSGNVNTWRAPNTAPQFAVPAAKKNHADWNVRCMLKWAIAEWFIKRRRTSRSCADARRFKKRSDMFALSTVAVCLTIRLRVCWLSHRTFDGPGMPKVGIGLSSPIPGQAPANLLRPVI